MSTVVIDVPEEALISLKTDREAFSKELPLLAAMKLFELGRLSSGRAALLAGVSRVEFLELLGRYGVSPFDLSEEELRRDLASA
jgi:predicted HTH domain antitoxin